MRDTLSGPETISVTELGTVARRITFSSAATPGARAAPRPHVPARPRDGTVEPIDVVLRVRPLSPAELLEGPAAVCVDRKRPGVVHVVPRNPALHNAVIRANARASFRFSGVYDGEASQTQVFQETALPLVDALFHGTDGLVFAYGTSNAGKTYTVQGAFGEPGILPRSLDVIFNSIAAAKKVVPPPGGGSSPAVAAIVAADSDEDDASAEGGEGGGGADVFSSARPREEVVLEVSPEPDYEVIVSYLEIYNEQCFDLLVKPLRAGQAGSSQDSVHCVKEEDPSQSRLKETYVSSKQAARHVRRPILKLKENRAEGIVYAEGLIEVPVTNVEDVQQLLAFGQKNRTVAQTCVNERSSRSHTIFDIKLVQKLPIAGKNKARAGSHKLMTSKLSIVDLAGNERTSRANTTGGDRLKEASHINKSLMNLGHCLEAMRKNQKMTAVAPPPRVLSALNPNAMSNDGGAGGGGKPKAAGKKPALRGGGGGGGLARAKRAAAPVAGHVPVPFRQSRLTRLFQRNLETGAAVMIVNVSPAVCDSDETIHSLKRAAVAREVSTAPTQKRARAVHGEQRHMISPSVLRSVQNKYETKATADLQKIVALEGEVSELRTRLDEAQLDFDEERARYEEERELLETELDERTAEGERLLQKLEAAEAQRAVFEAELRQEIVREMETMLATRGRRRREELELQLEHDDEEADQRIQAVTNTARKQMSTINTRRRRELCEGVARRVSLAVMPRLFEDDEDDEDDESDEDDEDGVDDDGINEEDSGREDVDDEQDAEDEDDVDEEEDVGEEEDDYMVEGEPAAAAAPPVKDEAEFYSADEGFASAAGRASAGSPDAGSASEPDA